MQVAQAEHLCDLARHVLEALCRRVQAHLQRVLARLRPAVGPNRTASYLPVTLAVMRHSGDQMRLTNLLGGSLDRRVDRGKVRHIPRGLSGLPEFAPLPGKSGEGIMRR